MNKIEQINAFETGRGIQYILDSAYDVLCNPIYMVDVNYNLIAYTDTPNDDRIWNELITAGTLGLETLELLANECIIEDIANANKTVYLENDKLQYNKAAGHIFNRDNLGAGVIIMTEYNTPFDEEILSAFEALADKIEVEIQDNDYFTMLAMAYHEDKINLLLDGSVINPVFYNPQAHILYSDFDDYLYLAVVHLMQNDIYDHVHQNRLVYYKSMLKSMFQSFKFSVYGDSIVMLMSSKNRFFNGLQFFSSHSGLFEENRLCMGISESFENMYELRKYYDQAIAALTKGMERKSDRRIFLHDDI